ncbi:MAG TPA: tRNA (adenosine(37)-N6)-threonylcarbamoyltransferase complex dimerization subunit type 1 TsaB [Ktedonobacteraceae bacterium]|jgi:tRNA threonylcarbamoyladenosine biosynthesis protein TsaB
MLLLALDTSTRQASVALCNEQHLYGEYSWQVGNNHSVELLERIRRLFAECGMSLSALDGIAVATGPGSFNGVRVAVAVAKTLAFALQRPLIGISTLEVGAAQHQQWPGPVCSLLAAGRAELYAACYLFDVQQSDGLLVYRPRQLGSSQLLAPQEVAHYIQSQIQSPLEAPAETQAWPCLCCGEISDQMRQVLSAHLPAPVFFAPQIWSVRRASVLASLASVRLAENRLDDPLVLEPFYLRRPSITTSARKQPLLGGGQSVSTDQSNHQPQTERDEGALRH